MTEKATESKALSAAAVESPRLAAALLGQEIA
jgi:hypothetical protein